MDKETARAARFGHRCRCVILDIDDFKHVNDTYGHLQGDAVLRAVGAILADESRGIDVAGPLRRRGVRRRAARDRQCRARWRSPSGFATGSRPRRSRWSTATGAIGVTASLGVATGPGRSLDADELIATADAALYEAKAAGKNRVVVADRRAAPVRRRSQGRDHRQGSSRPLRRK